MIATCCWLLCARAGVEESRIEDAAVQILGEKWEGEGAAGGCWCRVDNLIIFFAGWRGAPFANPISDHKSLLCLMGRPVSPWRCPLGWHDGWTISGASHCHTLEDKRPPWPCRECSSRFCPGRPCNGTQRAVLSMNLCYMQFTAMQTSDHWNHCKIYDTVQL